MIRFHQDRDEMVSMLKYPVEASNLIPYWGAEVDSAKSTSHTQINIWEVPFPFPEGVAREKGVLELPLNAVNHFSVFIIISLLIFTKFKYQKIILFFYTVLFLWRVAVQLVK